MTKFVIPSFRGVQFLCETADTPFARRKVIHEFINIDKPEIEDLGRKYQTYRLQAYVVGPDWEQQRDDLTAALLEPGEGVLVHPDLGRLLVEILDFQTSESKQNAQQIVYFDLLFVEASDDVPRSYVDAELTLLEVFNNYRSILAKQFNTIYSIRGKFAYAQNSIKGLIKDIEYHATGQFISDVANSIIDLNKTNLTLGSAVFVSFQRTYDSMRAVVDGRPQKYRQLIKAANTLQPQLSTVQTGIAAQSNQLMTNLVQVVRVHQMTEACIALIDYSYTSLDEAESIRAEVTKLYDEFAASLDDFELNNGLHSFYAAFIADFQTKAPELKRIEHFTTLTHRPALAILYQQTGSIEGLDDFLYRNQISNPVTVAPGFFEVL